MVNSCTFQERWLDEERFKYWFKEHPSDKHKAVCKLCNKNDFSTLKMGVSAIISQMNGKNHQRAKNVTSPLQSLYFKPKEPDEIDKENCSDCVPSTSSAAKDVVVEPKKQAVISKLSVRALDVEICWALKIVMMYASYRSCLNLNELFMVMFSDSDIAQNFKMSKTTVYYMIIYGIAEYFHRSLLSPLFDESLNDILNKDQMDIHIRFYDVDSGTISTRYLDSRFVFRPNANVLSGEIINAIKDLDGSRMIMLGMDGPDVNWCVFGKINAEREKHNHAPLFNVGSCDLHSIHGAFETGMTSNQWEIGKILKSTFKLFNKSPARKDLYITISNSNVFPKPLVLLNFLKNLISNYLYFYGR